MKLNTPYELKKRNNFLTPTSKSRKPVLRIRDVFPDLGSDFFLSRIEFLPSRIPEAHQRIDVFQPEKWFLSSRKYDPGCSSRIPVPDFIPIPDP
jgi:hypothetical protein